MYSVDLLKIESESGVASYRLYLSAVDLQNILTVEKSILDRAQG